MVQTVFINTTSQRLRHRLLLPEDLDEDADEESGGGEEDDDFRVNKTQYS